jgi:hypothetical protein
VLNLDSVEDIEDYEAVVDTLRERMRQTDLIFLFKHRIVLLLPHTAASACQVLLDRIQALLKKAIDGLPDLPFNRLTFPNDTMVESMEVLDWAENKLRS